MKLKLQAHLIALLLSISTLSFADDGDRKIKLSGLITDNVGQRISIKELEQKFTLFKIHSYNPWEKKAFDYTGILINELASTVGQAKITRIKLNAIDDYEMVIDKALWEKFRILLVTRENGKYLSVANKGPLRIVFPDYDDLDKEYANNLPLWMWMINKIEFLE